MWLFTKIKHNAIRKHANHLRNLDVLEKLQKNKKLVQVLEEKLNKINSKEYHEKIAYQFAEENGFQGDPNFYWKCAKESIEGITYIMKDSLDYFKHFIEITRHTIRNKFCNG